ncbi:MAG: DUF4433 domain-containing protein [Chloroflexota bacterium]|nr:DUF4433 domain-containing protein [Chloroflexota bacterium]
MNKPNHIYHFTHVRNLNSIVESGRLLCKNQLATTPYTDIAAEDIQRKRAIKKVPCGPRGTLTDYVPFFFAGRSPMMYFISRNVQIYPEGVIPLVYLVSSAQTVQAAGLPFVFTDGHPIMRITRFYDDLAHLSAVDWDVMSSRMWNDTQEFPDRQRRREAEFLVWNSFPWELVEGLSVVNKQMQSYVQATISASEYQPPVVVDRSLYYL